MCGEVSQTADVCVLLVRLSSHTHMKCDPSVSCGGEGGGGGEEEELGDWGGVDRLFTAKPTAHAHRHTDRQTSWLITHSCSSRTLNEDLFRNASVFKNTGRVYQMTFK